MRQDSHEAPAALRAVSDLAGAPVADAGGRPIGQLYGALAEADTGLLRYLDLALDIEPRHILVPIGHARVHEPDGPAIRLRAAVLDDLLEIPVYEPGAPIAPDDERALLAAYGRCFYGERYYAHPAYDHSGLFAGERDGIAGTGALHGDLVPLVDLEGARIHPADADPRGWPVLGGDDERLGRVADVMIDVEASAVRYLIVERHADRQLVLLPVGFARLDTVERRVVATGMRADDLDELPVWLGTTLDRADEEAIRGVLLHRLIPERRHALPDFRDTSS